MKDEYRIGERVKWNWGTGHGEGRIIQRFTEKTTRTIKGTEVVRDADEQDPAYLIQQDDGDEVLKLQSEVQKPG